MRNVSNPVYRTLPDLPESIRPDVFGVIVPETVENLITKPSFEFGTTGWFNGNLRLVGNGCPFGMAPLRILSTSTTARGNTTITGLTTGATYTVSAYVRAVGENARFGLADNDLAVCGHNHVHDYVRPVHGCGREVERGVIGLHRPAQPAMSAAGFSSL